MPLAGYLAILPVVAGLGLLLRLLSSHDLFDSSFNAGVAANIGYLLGSCLFGLSVGSLVCAALASAAGFVLTVPRSDHPRIEYSDFLGVLVLIPLIYTIPSALYVGLLGWLGLPFW